MMKKNRIISIALLFFVLLFLNVQNTYAIGGQGCVDWGPNGLVQIGPGMYAPNNGGGGGGGSGGGGGGDGYGCPGVGRHVYCNVNYALSVADIKLEENIYDSKGNYVGSALALQNKVALIAGRFVGIDAYEEYKKTFTVTTDPVCIRGEMVRHTRTVCHSTCGTGEAGDPIVSCDCETEVYWVLECFPCDVSVCECRGEVDAKLNELANSVDLRPSYEAKRQDVNDITKGSNKDQEPIINVPWNEEFSSKEIGDSFPANCDSRMVSKTVTLTYTYNLTPAWIDPITGKVKYESDCGQTGENSGYNSCLTEEDKKTYIKLPELKVYRNGKNIRVGYYFVPLNAKSSDLLKYNLYPNMARDAVTEAMCLTLINKYKDNKDDGEFWGNFIAFKNSGKPMYPTIKGIDDARKQVQIDHGCRMGLYTAFQIQQEFYHEKNGAINGYNFYYRPIDYSQPFPNGMIANDYWYKLYNRNTNATKVTYPDGENDKNNSQDLDNSFSKVTYETNGNYSGKTIREYNHATAKDKEGTGNGVTGVNRIYSSWSEMNANGSSQFVSGNVGVSRKSNCRSYYKLGCGPSNSNWAQCGKPEVCK